MPKGNQGLKATPGTRRQPQTCGCGFTSDWPPAFGKHVKGCDGTPASKTCSTCGHKDATGMVGPCAGCTKLSAWEPIVKPPAEAPVTSTTVTPTAAVAYMAVANGETTALKAELVGCHLDIAKLLLSEPVDHEDRAEIRAHLERVRELTAQ